MTRIEDDCVGCGLPCNGKNCEYSHVTHYYCDKCEDECDGDDMYELDGQELCSDCLLELTKIRR